MTSVGVSGPAGTWEIASVRLPPFISKPNKHKSSGSSLCWFAAFMCLQHNGSKDMRKQVLTCWWQSHYPNWFPFYTCIVGVNPQPWMPINTQTKECIASIRSAWVAPIPPNIPLKSWTEILQKSVQSWYIPFALQVSYDIRVSKIVHVQQLRVLDNEVLACKFDEEDPSLCSPPEC